MVQMDFLAANHVRIVGLCTSLKNATAHRADILAILQLSCTTRRRPRAGYIRPMR